MKLRISLPVFAENPLLKVTRLIIGSRIEEKSCSTKSANRGSFKPKLTLHSREFVGCSMAFRPKALKAKPK